MIIGSLLFFTGCIGAMLFGLLAYSIKDDGDGVQAKLQCIIWMQRSLLVAVGGVAILLWSKPPSFMLDFLRGLQAVML